MNCTNGPTQRQPPPVLRYDGPFSRRGAHVEFSTLVLTMYLDCQDQPEDDEKILQVAIDQSLTAAQLGMNPFFTEHHFRGPWHSAPLQFAAYLAPQIPPDCYLGFAVLSMPFYHPVRLVEG